jgi:hypothetical protein
MIKHFKRKTLASVFAFVLGAIVMTSPLMLYAASPPPPQFTQKGKINGSNVRHRATPVTGTILGLMQNDEIIYLNLNVIDNNYPAWCYIWRESTEQKGWMEWAYFGHA